MSMSIAYAMMSAEGIYIRSAENIRYKCIGLNTNQFGNGYVYYRVFAALSMGRSYRFDQVSETYMSRKVMQHLVDSGQGEFVSHPALPEPEPEPIPPAPAAPPALPPRAPMPYLAPLDQAPPVQDGPLLIYIWRNDYNDVVNHNQHHGYNFVIFDFPPMDFFWEHGSLTDDEVREFSERY